MIPADTITFMPLGLPSAFVDPATLPGDLADGGLTSDDHTFLWKEQAQITTAPLVIRTFSNGVPFPGDTGATVTIPAGTLVWAFFLHADPKTTTPVFDVRMDFGLVPLGFGLQQPDLDDSDVFATDGIDHRYEGLDGTDEGTVAGTEVRFVLGNAPGGRDQVRIFVTC